MTRPPLWSAAAALVGCLLAPAAVAQSPAPAADTPAHIAALIQTKARMRESLEELPNHTCRLDLRRAHLAQEARDRIEKRRQKRRRAAEGRTSFNIPMDASDSIALEVAIIDRRELYSFPESSRFEERPLAEMIGYGTISTGAFGGHARNIFVNDAGGIRYVGEESLDGRRVLRYDYRVELFRSGYTVGRAGQEAKVPYFGSFWTTAEDYELVRLTVRSDEIPPQVGIDEFATEIDYQSVSLDAGSFSMPRQARFTLSLSSGVVSVNEMQFSDCRGFVGSATLSFDDFSDRYYVEKQEAPESIDLPAGLKLPVRLATVIDSKTSQVGTLVEAELTGAIELGSGEVLPKGALLRGRIRRLEFYDDDGAAHYMVGIEFRELTFGSKRADLALSLEEIADIGGSRQDSRPRMGANVYSGGYGMPGTTERTIETYQFHQIPGVGVFSVRRKNFRLKPGFKMTWRTVSPEE